jgi:mannobiose 2-epimerase
MIFCISKVKYLPFALLLLFSGIISSSQVLENNLSDGKLIGVFEKSLKNDILNYWYPKALDTVDGGYLSNFTYDWQPMPDQPKMLVSQSRHIWTSSEAALFYHDSTYIKYAKHGVDFLINHMWDTTYGGFYNIRSKKGSYTEEIYQDEKRAYGNAFAIYGLTAYYKATKDTIALSYAKKTFRWLDEHSFDKNYGGYFDVMLRDGRWKYQYEKEKKKGVLYEDAWKDYNSSIHLLECFTELYKAWPDPLVKQRLQNLMTLVRDTFVGQKGYLTLFYTRDWKPISNRDSTENIVRKNSYFDHVSFGHDVETAYLLLEASDALGIVNDTITLKIAKRMVDHALVNGFDPETGSIYNEGYYFPGSKSIVMLDKTAVWWIQAEGMNSFLMMSRIFPKEKKYQDAFIKIWNYIDHNIIDKQYGEWYIDGIDTNPSVNKAPKASIWKVNYHNGRAMMNCIRILKKSN